jgi:hypothetical protein
MGDPRLDAPPDGLPSSGGDLAMLLGVYSLVFLPQLRLRTNQLTDGLLDAVRDGIRAYGYAPSSALAAGELFRQVQEAWDSLYDPYARSRLPGTVS